MTVLDMFSLKGRIALVTGGAGIYGKQIAESLAEAGATTIMASRNQETLGAQAEKFRERGLNVTAMKLDQSDPNSVRDLLDAIVKQHGRIDVLVNNAVARPMKDWSDPLEKFIESMAINMTGIFEMTRTFGDHMATQGKGSIINIGSIQGSVGPDYTLYEGLGWGVPPDYFMHKGGMIQLTRYAASKLGPQGVRVNIISPGGYNPSVPEVFYKRYSARTFLGRMGSETDLKGAIVYLASDASAYVTGANLFIDGGYSAK